MVFKRSKMYRILSMYITIERAGFSEPRLEEKEDNAKQASHRSIDRSKGKRTETETEEQAYLYIIPQAQPTQRGPGPG